MTSAALLDKDSATVVSTTTAVAARDSRRASFLGRNFLKTAAERCMGASVAAAAKHICTPHTDQQLPDTTAGNTRSPQGFP